jgi:histidinol phosphatase-like PHP family hydrolase
MEWLVRFARKNSAKIVVVHGETTMEPVLPGTNRRAIECGADILAHPGRLSREDARLAAAKGVYIEITTRKNHSGTNKEVIAAAKAAGAKLILNTDSHSDEDLIDGARAYEFLAALALSDADIKEIFSNSKALVEKKIG